MKIDSTSEARGISAVNGECVSAGFSMKFRSKIELLEKMENMENEVVT
jgi:hypothetical protein